MAKTRRSGPAPSSHSRRRIEDEVASVVRGEGQESRTGPRVLEVSRGRSFADRRSFVARVQYPGEPPKRVEFVGPSRDIVGPVVMITGEAGEQQTFVDDPSRFGVFSQDWVRRFFE